jgi:acyl dehydratase
MAPSDSDSMRIEGRASAGAGVSASAPVSAAAAALDEALAQLRRRVGQQAAVTLWERFDQAQVDTYGALTGEDLWIHCDPARAAASSFGGTIVQASLLMARFGDWIRQCGAWLPEPAMPLNVGYDRVRILGALPVGRDVQGRVMLDKLIESEGRVRLHLKVEAESPEADRPIITAEWIVMFMLP